MWRGVEGPRYWRGREASGCQGLQARHAVRGPGRRRRLGRVVPGVQPGARVSLRFLVVRLEIGLMWLAGLQFGGLQGALLSRGGCPGWQRTVPGRDAKRAAPLVVA